MIQRRHDDMSSIHNVKRLHRNRMGIIPGKPGEHKIRRFKNPFIAVCVICKKEWPTIYNFAKCCSRKCSNKYQYLKNHKKRLNYGRKYYWENRKRIFEYKHLPNVVARRKERERAKKRYE